MIHPGNDLAASEVTIRFHGFFTAYLFSLKPAKDEKNDNE